MEISIDKSSYALFSAIGKIETVIGRFEGGKKDVFLAASIKEIIWDLEKMHDDIALEAIKAEDDFSFEYFLF